MFSLEQSREIIFNSFELFFVGIKTDFFTNFGSGRVRKGCDGLLNEITKQKISLMGTQIDSDM